MATQFATFDESSVDPGKGVVRLTLAKHLAAALATELQKSHDKAMSPHSPMPLPSTLAELDVLADIVAETAVRFAAAVALAEAGVKHLSERGVH